MANQVAEDFTLKNQDDEEVHFYETLDKADKGVVIFVYPKANTAGCTKQACAFRDNYDQIKNSGYNVIGISKSAPAAQASWKKAKELPFDLLSDEAGDVLKGFGCISGSNTVRSVFVVDKLTKSFVLHSVKIAPEESVAAAISAITTGPATSEESDTENNPPTKAKQAKAKPKAKAAASRGRAPSAPRESPTRVRKTSDSKRTGSTKAPTPQEDEALDCKKPPLAKKAVKRNEPSGGADAPESKETKKQRKVSTDPVKEKRATSHQPERRPTTRKTAEKAAAAAAAPTAASSKKVKEETKAISKKATAAAGRSTSATRAKRGKQ